MDGESKGKVNEGSRRDMGKYMKEAKMKVKVRRTGREVGKEVRQGS